MSRLARPGSSSIPRSRPAASRTRGGSSGVAARRGRRRGGAAARFSTTSVQQAGHAALPLVNAAYRRSRPARGARRARRRVPDQRRGQSRQPGAGPDAGGDGARASGRRRRSTRSHARVEATCAHVAPVSGAVFRALGLPLRDGAASGAVRHGARRAVRGRAPRHRRQLRGAAAADALRAHGSNASPPSARRSTATDLAQTAPLLDLLQAGHDRLYSRLFQS